VPARSIQSPRVIAIDLVDVAGCAAGEVATPTKSIDELGRELRGVRLAEVKKPGPRDAIRAFLWDLEVKLRP